MTQFASVTYRSRGIPLQISEFWAVLFSGWRRLLREPGLQPLGLWVGASWAGGPGWHEVAPLALAGLGAERIGFDRSGQGCHRVPI